MAGSGEGEDLLREKVKAPTPGTPQNPPWLYELHRLPYIHMGCFSPKWCTLPSLP